MKCYRCNAWPCSCRAGQTIIVGDCRTVLRELPAGSVNCCVTSPPYWGLRDYGCDGQIGLESTPEEFTSSMVDVFSAVRGAMKDDGTVWLNLGDSYNAYNGAAGPGGWPGQERRDGARPKLASGFGLRFKGLKPKDLVGIPWRVALAMQADGWYLRQDIIWAKPNPMPESVTDRCTKAHEYIFLLSKSERYYYDQEAILEPVSQNTHARLAQDVEAQIGSERDHAGGKTNGNMKAVGRSPGNKSHKGTTAYEAGDERHRTKAGLVKYAEKHRKIAAAGSGIKNNESFNEAVCLRVSERNKRSVWTVTTKPYKGAHFATFPPDLIQPCILAGCPSGGVVLDPFLGSGTTAMVARKNGCKSIGIELNPEYAKLAVKRLRQGSLQFTEDE